ncbi:MAG: thermonuclease family protein [Anaerolineaceae bacterium]|nr:thermonuclease family protein [Anaerolineaceae bacterium]MCB9102214.1 thermonuclease family protein [Anaerolineales bacterium]MCB9104944.1 thermonuclease family protein [Anaerolineales bacterium]
MKRSAALKKAIAAIKAGDKETARDFLLALLNEQPENEAAWLWLTNAVDGYEQKVKCLEQVLAINPANEKAKQGLIFLQKKHDKAARNTPATKPLNNRSKFPLIAISIIAIICFICCSVGVIGNIVSQTVSQPHTLAISTTAIATSIPTPSLALPQEIRSIDALQATSLPLPTPHLEAATPTPTRVVADTPTVTSTPLPISTPDIFQYASVVRVIDGDTIEVMIDSVEYTVRYILIDTPETHGEVEPFGAAAAEANRQLTEGKTVLLEKDVSETDRYGRLLRYVYVDDMMVNELLVQIGLAQVATYPPDVKYLDRILAAQNHAQDKELGMWGTRPIREPTATFTPIPPAAPLRTETNPVCNCGSNTYNCSDFSSHQSAQQCYEYCKSVGAGDVHDLDRDHDGDACEALH